MDPAMSIARLSLLDRGVTFAIAHVRGGGELGRAWYENGKTLTKKNTFSDFVACARHLVDAGYTTTDAMVAEGGSAGGLLMGAVANLAPELFTGILAEGGISIDALLQRPGAAGAGEARTDVIILTHDTVEGRMTAAIAKMQALPTVLAPIVRIRKEDLA